VACFYEGEEIPGIGIVVDEHSACLDGYPGILIPRNHREMQKFENRDQEGYSRVVGQAIRWIEQLDRTTSELEPEAEPEAEPEPEPELDPDPEPDEITQRSTEEERPSELTPATDPVDLKSTADLDLDKEKQLTNLLGLLSFPEASSLMTERSFNRWADSTCDWLFKNSLYDEWFRNARDIMWVIGHPGSGKTTLMRYASERSPNLDEASHQATFFFYNRGSQLQRSPEGLLRSLLRQILEQSRRSKSFWHLVDDFVKRHKSLADFRNWAVVDLFDLLERCISLLLETTPLRIFIDALDECRGGPDSEDHEKVIRNLAKRIRRMVETHKQSEHRLSVCISCRHVPNLTTLETYYQVVVEKENGGDIGEFVDQELADTYLKPDSPFLAELKEAILERADGSFQWTKLVTSKIVDMLRIYRPQEEIMAAIRSLPVDLTRLYDEIIGTLLEREDRDLSLRLFRLACFSHEELSVSALRAALNINSKSPAISSDDEMTDRLPILSGGLATIVHPVRRKLEYVEASDSDDNSSVHSGIYSYAVHDGVWERTVQVVAPAPKIAPSRSRSSSRSGSSSRSAAPSGSESPPDDRRRYLNFKLPGRPTICLIHQSVQDYLVEHGFRLLDPSLGDGENPETKGRDYLLETCLAAWAMSEPVQSCRPLLDYLNRNGPRFAIVAKSTMKWIVADLVDHQDLEQVGIPQIIAKVDSLPTGNHAELLSWILAELELARLKSKSRSASRGTQSLPPWSASNARGPKAQGRAFSMRPGWNKSWFLSDGEKAVLAERIVTHLFMRQMAEQFPFHLYAATHLMQHLSDSSFASGPLNLEALIPAQSLLTLSRICNPVVKAVEVGDPRIVAALLKHKGLPRELLNKRYYEDDTPLMEAVIEEDSIAYRDIVAILLREPGIDVDARDHYQRTALMLAANLGYSAIVDLLLAKADVHARDSNDDTALTLSAAGGHVDCVRSLIRSGSRIHDCDNRGIAALSWAAYFGSPETVACLLEAGAQPKLRDFLGRPALYHALEGGHEDTISQLLAHGASFGDLSQQDFDYLIRFAITSENIQLLERILDTGGRVWQVFRSHVYPSVHPYTSTIDNNIIQPYKGPPIAPDMETRLLRSSYLNSHLAIAVQNDKEAAVRVLCEHGKLFSEDEMPIFRFTRTTSLASRTSIPSLSSYHILSHAAYYAAARCIKVLVSLGLDVNDRIMADGNSLLHLAVAFSMPSRAVLPFCMSRTGFWNSLNNEQLIHSKRQTRSLQEALLECNIDTTMSNSVGETALMAAVRYLPVDSDVVDHMIRSPKVKVNTVTSQGTALVQAVGVGADRWVRLLLDRPDIDPRLGSPGNITPLHWAAMKGNVKAMHHLLYRDSSLATCLDENGRNPLVYAAYYQRPEAVKVLLDFDRIRPGDSLNQIDMSGRAALSYAAQSTIDLPILPRGAPRAASSAAQVTKSAHIVAMICSHPQVQVNISDNMGATPLDWCLESLSRRQFTGAGRIPPSDSSNVTGTAAAFEPGKLRSVFHRKAVIDNAAELRLRLDIMDCLRANGGTLTAGGLTRTRSSAVEFWLSEPPFFPLSLAYQVFDVLPSNRMHLFTPPSATVPRPPPKEPLRGPIITVS